jgi:hypothetical protein
MLSTSFSRNISASACVIYFANEVASSFSDVDRYFIIRYYFRHSSVLHIAVGNLNTLAGDFSSERVAYTRHDVSWFVD